MKIKVASSSTPPVSVVEYKYPGAMRNQAGYPIRLTAIVPLTYFQVKPPLSILGMLLGNPMILIFLVVMGVMVFFPNTLKEIAESEEFKKAQSGTYIRIKYLPCHVISFISITFSPDSSFFLGRFFHVQNKRNKEIP